MRKVRVEHGLTNAAWRSDVWDVETGRFLNDIISLDLILEAEEPSIKGVLTLYVRDSNGEFVMKSADHEFLTKTEEVEVMYVDKFDQSQVAISE